MKYDIGIRECSKCEHNLKCEECVYLDIAEKMQQELAELRKNYWIAQEELKAQAELIRKQKAEIAELKKHPHCPPCVDFCLYSENYEKHDKAVRAEAVREFATKFAREIKNAQYDYQNFGRECCACVCDFINHKLSAFADKMLIDEV